MKFKPLNDRVLLQRTEAEEKTEGGLYIPDTAKEKPQRATVIAVGPGRLIENGDRIPVAFSEGDTVLFGKYSGTEVALGGEDYVIMREDEILAVIED
jgi:chaperonin GroES